MKRRVPTKPADKKSINADNGANSGWPHIPKSADLANGSRESAVTDIIEGRSPWRRKYSYDCSGLGKGSINNTSVPRAQQR